MKKIILAASVLVGVLSQAQEKVNAKELQNIATELESKFSQDLQIESNRTGQNVETLIASGFQGIYNGSPVYFRTDDVPQIKSMNVDALHAGDIENGVAVTGDGMVVYVWDGGNILVNHQEFLGRVEMLETSTLSYHATGVTGVIASSGVNPLAKGIAYQVDVKGLNFDGNAAYEMSTESSKPENSEYMVSNHSYGSRVGWEEGNLGAGNGWYWFGNTELSETESNMFGSYTDYDAYLDDILYNAPQHSAFKSSGNNNNEGPSTAVNHFVRNSSGAWVSSNTFRPKDCAANGGYDCLSFAGTTAKNNIVVGAILPLEGEWYESPNDIIATGFSSYGPTDDGRIKPEITAIGQSVFAPYGSTNSNYANWSGTSFSAPAVTGVGVLLQQLKKIQTDGAEYLRSDMMKALLTHTAFESGSDLGPDYKFGYGLVNALGAAEVLLNTNENAFTENRILENKRPQTFTVTASGTEPLKVSIAWLDPASTGLPWTQTPLNDPTPKLVNDLDLRVYQGGNVYYPWILDPQNPSAAATQGDNTLDNLEQVLIENPVAGQNYTISVSHKGDLVTPITPVPEVSYQHYALVVTGVEGEMSVDDVNKTTVSVYPNPVVDELNIKTDKQLNNANLSIFNAAGQIVYKNDYNSITKNEAVNVKSLPAGTYILLIKSEEGIISKKFIKK